VNSNERDIPSDVRLQREGSHEPSGGGADPAPGGAVAGSGAASTTPAANRRRGGGKPKRKRAVDSTAPVGTADYETDRANGPQAQEPERVLGSGVAAGNGAGAAGSVLAKPRKKPVRRVFGRLQMEVGGERLKFELTKRGLEVRRRHKRTVRVLTFAELANHTRQQALLFPNL
jgi:hypothetical protein